MSTHTQRTPTRTASGITDDATGNRVIPSSRRADGSIRKERKVKPGFTPQEDVQRFRPRRLQEQDALRASGSGRTVPGAARATSASSSRSVTPASDDAWPSLGAARTNGAKANGSTSASWKSNGSTASHATKTNNPTATNSTPAWRRSAPVRKEQALPAKKVQDDADAPDDWEQEVGVDGDSEDRREDGAKSQANDKGKREDGPTANDKGKKAGGPTANDKGEKEEDGPPARAKEDGSVPGPPATPPPTITSTSSLEDALASLSVREHADKD